MKPSSLLFLAAVLPFAVADDFSDFDFCSSSNKCPDDMPYCVDGSCVDFTAGFGDCNPQGSANASVCMPQPRMSSFTANFSSLDDFGTYGSQWAANGSQNEWVYFSHVDIEDDSLVLTMKNATALSASVESTKYLWYGKVGASIKTSLVIGVGVSFELESSVGDKIAFLFGTEETTNVSTTYAAPEDPSDFNFLFSGEIEESSYYDAENWHHYEIDWKEDSIAWSLDGDVVRTLEKEDTWNETSHRYEYPSTPAALSFELATVWMGVNTDNDEYLNAIKKPSHAYVKNVTVEAYGLPKSANVTDDSQYNAYKYTSDSHEVSVELVNDQAYESGNSSVSDSSSSTASGNATSTVASSSSASSEGGKTSSSDSGAVRVSQPRYVRSLFEILVLAGALLI